MSKLRIIGLRVEKYIGEAVSGHNMDFTYSNELFEKHILCCKTADNKNVEIELSHSEGECGSGWTTASWGEKNIVYVKNFRTFNYFPIKKIELDEKILEDDIYDYHDNVVTFSYDGGDSYYPSGYYNVDMHYFRESARIKNKRPVWIFKGESNLGKTYLTSHLDMDVYETDCSEHLPESINASIIVLGNKYKFNLDDIKERLFDIDNTEVHLVDFSKD
jgi:hypothetical protein